MKTSKMNNILEKYGSISEKKFTMMHCFAKQETPL